MKTTEKVKEIHEIVGKKWNIIIIYELSKEKMRFKDLKEAIPEISYRLLSNRLQNLVHEKIIKRTVYALTKVRIEYELTEKGRNILKIFSELE